MARFLLHLIRNEPFFVRASASKLVQCSKKAMAVVTLIFVFVVYFVDNVMCGCNIFVGPSGGTDCVLLKPFFSEYQYATCLTESYIRARSGRRHRCISPIATYCYYQCMLELNNIDAGEVFKNCSCDPESAVTEQPETLPSWCYSPDGTSCQWYRECLEERYPCSNEENSYALDFGEKFCVLYNQHSSNFDEVGRTWIDAVRQCLQASLVDLLRPYQHPTCDEIRERAFNSHSGCYLDPAEGVTSFCDIGFENWLRVLVTIKSSLTHKEVIEEALVTAGKCFFSYINRTVSMVVSWKEKHLDKLNNMVNDLANAANGKVNDDIFIVVLNSDELNDTRLKRGTSSQTFSSLIKLLMLPRNKYDLNYNGISNRTTEELITSFLDHVESREITYEALDGIELLEFRECNDTNCDTPVRTVIETSQTTVLATQQTMPVTTPTQNAATNFPFKLVTTLLLGSCVAVTMML